MPPYSRASAVRSAPGNLGAQFKLYRNVGALYDVFFSLTEAAGAFGPKDDFQELSQEGQQLDTMRHNLADRVEQLATAQEAELGRLRAQAAQSGRSLSQIITLASIVEREAQLAEQSLAIYRDLSEPWRELNARQLAALLAPYEITSQTVRLPDGSLRKGFHRVILPDDAGTEVFFQSENGFNFIFHHLARGDARPCRDHFTDYVAVHAHPHQRRLSLKGIQLCGKLVQFRAQRRVDGIPAAVFDLLDRLVTLGVGVSAGPLGRGRHIGRIG